MFTLPPGNELHTLIDHNFDNRLLYEEGICKAWFGYIVPEECLDFLCTTMLHKFNASFKDLGWTEQRISEFNSKVEFWLSEAKKRDLFALASNNAKSG